MKNRITPVKKTARPVNRTRYHDHPNVGFIIRVHHSSSLASGSQSASDHGNTRGGEFSMITP